MTKDHGDSRNLAHEYTVKLDLFEGPLDLLLYLVSRAEVDIVDISVAQITAQYLTYLDLMRELNIDLASDYLSMAATLLRLKARELLPAEEQDEPEEQDEIYSRQQLIDKLLEYKKFKEAAGSLRVYEAEQFGSFTRGTPEQIEPSYDRDEELTAGEVSIFDLFSAFKRVLERAVEEHREAVPRWIVSDDVKLDDRIEHLLAMLEEHDEVCFEELFVDDVRRLALVVTFMALLELVQMKRIRFRQEGHLSAIYVSKVTEGLDRADEIPEEES
jgi:segregation and condensation protein A